MYRGAVERYIKLKSDIQVNAPNIDRLVLAQITSVMDSIDNILERTRFLLSLDNPKFSEFDLIGEIPVEDFNNVYSFLDKLKIFDGYTVKNLRHYKPEEIISNWRRAEAENDRFYSNPNTYSSTHGRGQLVFNYATLKNLQALNPNDGDVLTVFKDAT